MFRLNYEVMKDPYNVQSRLGQCLYDHSNKCPEQQKISIHFHSVKPLSTFNTTMCPNSIATSEAARKLQTYSRKRTYPKAIKSSKDACKG